MSVLAATTEKVVSWDEWIWRELREGGWLQRYLAQEVAESKERQRAVSRQFQDRKQNFKSEFELMGAMPAREWIRWRMHEPHFGEDPEDWRSLRRDNPDMAACIPWRGKSLGGMARRYKWDGEQFVESL